MPRKKKNHVPKSGAVWHRTAEEATLDKMPKFNAHACGTGAHGDAKYNRAKQKRSWQRELANEGARDFGRLSFYSGHKAVDSFSDCPQHPALYPSIQPFIHMADLRNSRPCHHLAFFQFMPATTHALVH